MSRSSPAGTRRVGALGAVVALALAGAVAVLAPAAPAGAATSRVQAVTAAARYGSSHGYYIGVSVLDTRTGHIYGAGHHTATFASESVVKVMIAARIYVQGRLHGSTASRAYYMITHSDDDTASSFYGSVGGDSLINWVKSYYKVPDLGSPPRRTGWWGNTHITPDGLVKLYAKLVRTPFGPWLLNAMHHASKYGSDGFYQWFGLKSASPTAAIKQGWGTDYDNWSDGADENTTGFVNGDRYAVAILARGPASTYGGPIGSMLTGAAKALLPDGSFPSGTPTITRMTRTTGRTRGHGRDTIHGTNLDGTTKVYFGIHRAPVVTVVSPSTLYVETPPAPAGRVGVRIVTSHGTSSAPGPGFTYYAPPTVTGVSPSTVETGAVLTVRGTNYLGGAYLVHFISTTTGHDTQVRPRAVASSTSLTAIVPSGLSGTIDVRVSTPFGTSPPSPSARTDIGPPAPGGTHPAAPVAPSSDTSPSGSPLPEPPSGSGPASTPPSASPGAVASTGATSVAPGGA